MAEIGCSSSTQTGNT